MTDIPIPSGPTNGEIIEQAYMLLGVTDAMFGRTEEEMATGLALLTAMMAEWPFDQLGFDFQSPVRNERSGIAMRYKHPVAASLAERLVLAAGGTISPSLARMRAISYSRLCSAFAKIADGQFPANTIAGAGGVRLRSFLPGPG